MIGLILSVSMVIAQASIPPYFGDVTLLSEPCKTKPDGRQATATFRGEAIGGCWIRAMGLVFVAWDDETTTTFEDSRFFGPK